MNQLFSGINSSMSFEFSSLLIESDGIWLVSSPVGIDLDSMEPLSCIDISLSFELLFCAGDGHNSAKNSMLISEYSSSIEWQYRYTASKTVAA